MLIQFLDLRHLKIVFKIILNARINYEYRPILSYEIVLNLFLFDTCYNAS